MLSIARVAQLLATHERTRGHKYSLAFVMRYDLFVSAPVRLDSFDPTKITFSEVCVVWWCVWCVVCGVWCVCMCARARDGAAIFLCSRCAIVEQDETHCTVLPA